MAENNNEKTIEQTLDELDGIIAKMQAGDLSLEQTFELYRSGVSMIGEVNKKIEKIECDIKEFNAEEDD